MSRTISRLSLGAGVLALSVLSGCNDFLGSQRFIYTGYVIDGSTGQRINAYSMSLKSADIDYDVEVEGDGLFITSEVRGSSAYTVTVTAAGYRPFQALESGDSGGQTPARVALREVVVFPEGIVAPAVQLDVIDAADNQFALSGNVRLVPTGSGVSSFDLGVDVSTTTRWNNDLDQQNQVITADITNSRVDIAEGVLTFGVTYRVDVFNVPGYRVANNAATVTGGVNIGAVIDLSTLSDPAPVIVTPADMRCLAFPSLNPLPGLTTIAQLEFSEPIEFVDEEDAQNALSSGIGDSAGAGGIVRNPDPGDQEQLVINGATLELQWNPQEEYTTFNTAVNPPPTLDSVAFFGLSAVRIRRAGSVGSIGTLSTLLGTSSISCTGDN